MENEARHLQAERAQLQEQSTAFRDECASLRTVSENIEASRVEVSQAAARVVADRASAERLAAELSEQRSSVAASGDQISKARGDLANALNRIGILENTLMRRGDDLEAELKSTRAQRATDLARESAMAARIDSVQQSLDFKIDYLRQSVLAETDLLRRSADGTAIDNKARETAMMKTVAEASDAASKALDVLRDRVRELEVRDDPHEYSIDTLREEFDEMRGEVDRMDEWIRNCDEYWEAREAHPGDEQAAGQDEDDAGPLPPQQRSQQQQQQTQHRE